LPSTQAAHGKVLPWAAGGLAKLCHAPRPPMAKLCHGRRGAWQSFAKPLAAHGKASPCAAGGLAKPCQAPRRPWQNFAMGGPRWPRPGRTTVDPVRWSSEASCIQVVVAAFPPAKLPFASNAVPCWLWSSPGGSQERRDTLPAVPEDQEEASLPCCSARIWVVVRGLGLRYQDQAASPVSEQSS